MLALLPQGLVSASLTKEKALSIGASIAVNLAMIVAFASIADVGVDDISGASLVVVGLAGTDAKGDAPEMSKAHSVPAPPPAPEAAPPMPTPDVTRPVERPIEPRIALLQRPEPVAEPTDAAPAPPAAERRPAPNQLREAAEQQRKAQEAVAKVRAAEQAQRDANAAASDRPAARSGGPAGGSGGYGPLIYRHLQRFKKPNTVGAGATLLSMAIDNGGAVLSVSVMRSSGSAAFDREAQQIVRRASPFPTPPEGANRTFQFEIKGR
jgi:protein TonB